MVYFDCAATTYPKPETVATAVLESFSRFGGNPGRSGHVLSMETSRKVYEVREKAAAFFGAAAENAVFSLNCTHSLNMALKGALSRGGHVITSSLEHNSVIRPLYAMAQKGKISFSVAGVSLSSQEETVENFKRLLRNDTRAIVSTHGSNVTGTLTPLKELGQLAHDNGALFIVDAAQTAGVIPIDMEQMNIDILCAPGHKGLYGPMGTGIMILRPGLTLDTLLEGGTGSASLDPVQPELPPERYESGTVNVPGIAGLGAGIDFVEKEGISKIYAHESGICAFVTEELRKIPGISLVGGGFSPGKNAPIVSFNVRDMDSSEAAFLLSEKGFMLRGGFHCAGVAHRYLKTDRLGAVRFSPGWFNTLPEAERFIDTVNKL